MKTTKIWICIYPDPKKEIDEIQLIRATKGFLLSEFNTCDIIDVAVGEKYFVINHEVKPDVIRHFVRKFNSKWIKIGLFRHYGPIIKSKCNFISLKEDY